MRHLCRVENIERCGSNWPERKCAISTQKFGYLGPKVNFLYGNPDFCQQGISPVCPGLKLSELWVIFLGSPLFLAVSCLCHFISINTLNFGLFSTKLGGTVRAIKNMTQHDNGPGSPGQRSGSELLGNGRFYFQPESVFVANNAIYPKKTPKIS